MYHLVLYELFKEQNLELWSFWMGGFAPHDLVLMVCNVFPLCCMPEGLWHTLSPGHRDINLFYTSETGYIQNGLKSQIFLSQVSSNMALKIPPGKPHWTRISISMQANKQCFQESWCTCLKAREGEGFSETLPNTTSALLGLPTVLAFYNISLAEFVSELPCHRTNPRSWSFPQKWTCSAQELPELSCFLWCLAWFWGQGGDWSAREGLAKELELLRCLSKCGVGRTKLQTGSCQACKHFSSAACRLQPPQQQHVCSLVLNRALVGREISSPCAEHSNLLRSLKQRTQQKTQD